MHVITLYFIEQVYTETTRRKDRAYFFFPSAVGNTETLGASWQQRQWLTNILLNAPQVLARMHWQSARPASMRFSAKKDAGNKIAEDDYKHRFGHPFWLSVISFDMCTLCHISTWPLVLVVMFFQNTKRYWVEICYSERMVAANVSFCNECHKFHLCH